MSVADETLSVGGPPVRRWSTRWLGPFAVGLALLSALLTFLVLTGLTGIIPTHEVVVAVLLGNLLATGFLLAVIGWEVWRVIQAKRKGRAGSRLHIRIVALFSVIAAVPAVLVAIVASITLDRGLDRWFSQRTRAVIENSITVAQGYLQEHAQTIRGDIMAMANDIGRAKPLFDTERDRFKQFLTAQASVRGLPGALLIDKEGNILERADLRIGREFAPPPANVISEVNETQPQVAVIPDENYVAAIIQLRNFDSTYLYVARLLDPRIVQQVKEARESVAEYATFETRRLGVQVAFGLMYTVIALIVLLSAVWIGLNFATRLVAPIRRLIGAADAVSGGNLYVHVPVHRSEGDLAQLGDTFNKMIAELRSQRDDLIGARDLIDSRRRFTEAVLSGASAGIVGVDPEGHISILNRSAQKLIDSAEEDVIGRPLSECIPELAPLLKEAQTGSQRLAHGQVTISRNGRERNVSVRVTSEQTAHAQHGYVLTLDDITDLVQAQRSSAWADIARRIAHEIKNPLTPIQLSAERLRRKFGRHITEDRAIFDQCTETIVRQVDDIRRMVDEFSKFARMPKAVIADEDLADTVRQVAFLMRVGHPEIDIEVTFAEDKMPVRFDRRLIAQALTNLIKNAAEAIAAVPPNESKGRGKIRINTARDNSGVVIDIIDNGVGLPKENRNRLLEPYFTTREKGTGLGLAIVGRILEEHGGRLELMDSPEVSQGGRGAWIRARFAVEDDNDNQDQSTPDDARKSAVASER